MLRGLLTCRSFPRRLGSIIQPRVLFKVSEKSSSEFRLCADRTAIPVSVVCRRKRSRRCRALLHQLADAHLLPVVAKLLAAVETHDIGAVTMARCRHLAARRERKRSSLMGTSKHR